MRFDDNNDDPRGKFFWREKFSFSFRSSYRAIHRFEFIVRHVFCMRYERDHVIDLSNFKRPDKLTREKEERKNRDELER